MEPEVCINLRAKEETMTRKCQVYLRLFFLPFLNFTTVPTGSRAMSGEIYKQLRKHYPWLPKSPWMSSSE